MKNLTSLLNRAKTSKFYLWILNAALLRIVPFNKPHNLKVTHVGDDEITITAYNIKNNRNHIKGIHACLLATLCEYASGLSLLSNLNASEYRIILKNINMTYHYQAKTDVHVDFKLTKEEVFKNFIEPLKTTEALFHEFKVEVYDTQKNHICTGLINWQIKAWKNVKMKV